MRFFLASELVKICHRHNVPLIINDDIELAARVDADGVHIGREDGAIAQARKRLGADAIIGVSCYNFVERAIEAQAQGATYVAFGRFFPSTSKPLAAPAKIETLIQAKQLLKIPIVAIGGIMPENGAQLLAAGADLLAVIGGLFETASRNNQPGLFRNYLLFRNLIYRCVMIDSLYIAFDFRLSRA